MIEYLIEGGKASSEAHLKRRIQEATAPSPTRAAQKGNPGPSSPGAGVRVDSNTETARGKKARTTATAVAGAQALGRPTLDFAGLSPGSQLRGMHIAPGGGAPMQQ